MTDDLKDYPFDALFTAGESPGSQYAYKVDRELQRRRELAQQQVDAKIIASADAQIEAAKHAGDAARASVETARWTRVSAIMIALSVVMIGLAALLGG